MDLRTSGEGRLLGILVDGPPPAGEQAVIWDGRDESGSAQASVVAVYGPGRAC